MPENKYKGRYKALQIHLRPAEYAQLEKDYEASDCQSMSQYGRKVLLGQRIRKYSYNRSLDTFTEASILLLKELEACRDKVWLTEVERRKVSGEITTIKEFIIKTYDHVRRNIHNQKDQ